MPSDLRNYFNQNFSEWKDNFTCGCSFCAICYIARVLSLNCKWRGSIFLNKLFLMCALLYDTCIHRRGWGTQTLNKTSAYIQFEIISCSYWFVHGHYYLSSIWLVAFPPKDIIDILVSQFRNLSFMALKPFFIYLSFILREVLFFLVMHRVCVIFK